MADTDVVVIGGGPAAAAVVQALRERGHDGSVLLVCAGGTPVHRPAVATDYLRTLDPVTLHPGGAYSGAVAPGPEWYTRNDIEIVQARAEAVDPRTRSVRITGHGLRAREITAGDIVLATGSLPRRPEIPGGDDVLALHAAADADALREAVPDGGTLVVLGAGLWGAEVAAVMQGFASVHLIDPDVQPLAARIGVDLAQQLEQQHLDAGVVRHVTAAVAVHRDGSAWRVDLADGTSVRADAVLAAAGLVADDALARGAGMACAPGGGVLVDDTHTTGRRGIRAVGDAAFFGDGRRFGHLEHAIWSGECVGTDLAGMQTQPLGPVGFSMERYGTRLDVLGFLSDADRVITRSVDGRVRVVCGLKGTQVVGAAGLDAEHDLRALRRIMQRRTPVQPELLTDTTVPILDARVGA